MLAYRMLGIKGNHAEEFEKANIVVKTIRIGKNNKIKESMSFPTFKFKELLQRSGKILLLEIICMKQDFYLWYINLIRMMFYGLKDTVLEYSI